MLFGGILVMGCAFVSAAVTLRVDGPTEAIAVQRDLPAGHTLAAADLRFVKASTDAELIAAGRAASVIGRTLTVPMVAGALLVDRNVGEPAYPMPGQAIIGVAVKPGQYPPELAAGDRVAVVAVPGDAATSDVKVEPTTIVAVVTRVSQPDQPQNPAVVTLLLARTYAEKITAPAAQGLVSLMQISPEEP
ncbi:SAF domain-containing protein [Sphaerisporangium sp. B11E5]|uniref:SAF domain-containing protein n=1 Tax=Sphaerisporangium sp. B11E5 TaxID=3153563 RepID=UPI00325CF977